MIAQSPITPRPKGTSPVEEARVLGALFVVIVCLEPAALLICLGPLLPLEIHRQPGLIPIAFRWVELLDWQKHCAEIGAVATFVAFSVGVYALGTPRLRDKYEPHKEVKTFRKGVLVIFVANVIALLLVISRSGGPLLSPYAPLIPIQFALMALIEAQTESALKSPPRARIVAMYSILAAVALAATYLLDDLLVGQVSFVL